MNTLTYGRVQHQEHFKRFANFNTDPPSGILLTTGIQHCTFCYLYFVFLLLSSVMLLRDFVQGTLHSGSMYLAILKTFIAQDISALPYINKLNTLFIFKITEILF